MFKKAFLKRLVAVPNASAENKKDLLILDKKRKDCDLVLQEKIISRKHVVFRWEDSHWLIECLNATNGVCLNGEPLNKNEVRKLPENAVISFGPTYLTDFLYKFSTEQSASDRSIMGKIDLSKLNREVSVANEPKPKSSIIASPLLSSKKRRSISRSQLESMETDELEANNTKMKQLNERIAYLEKKVLRYKTQRKEAYRRSRKQLKQINRQNVLSARQKTIIRNARISLSKERLKKKELQKRLDEEKAELQLYINRELKIREGMVEPWMAAASGAAAPEKPADPTSSQIVRKYNEMFSEDFTCGICLELFIEPVTLTCGHTTCKFCVNEWFKRNQSKRECPLCRTGIRMSWYKNVLIENVIDKYLLSAQQEVLDTRKRLIEERAKVVEKSKSEEAANPPQHRHRHRHVFNLGLEGAANPLIEFFGARNNINYHDLSFNDISDEGTSNEDEDEEDLMDDDIHYLDMGDFDEEFDEEDEEEIGEIDEIVIEDDQDDQNGQNDM